MHSKKSFIPLFLLVLLGWTACVESRSPEIRSLGEVPHDPDASHDRNFVPTGGLEQLSPSLFVYRDSCNVYIVKQGREATLVDFGTGDVLGVLKSIGVDRIQQVLVTHHHRDQVQGLCDLGESIDFDVVVPREEGLYFKDVESFWEGVRIYLNYNLRSHFNTIRRSVRVDREVVGGEVIDWDGLQFKVLETPGPTDHSVSYRAVVDSRTVVFSGDLISGRGKVHNWFDLHWNYYGFTQGIDASDQSFLEIRAEKPEWLLPSHGAPIKDPDEAMAENSRVYAQLRELLVPNELHRTMGELRQITPHLIHLGGLPERSLGALSTYAILSDSGKALLYDYGYTDLEQVDRLKTEYKVSNIDIVTFSHYHDDHLIRAHDLLRDNETEFWVFENMVDILENPARYRLPCLVPFPIQADRVVHDGEKIPWEEYTLEFFHMPGQTQFHQGLVTVIDGKKVMFTGDNTWKKIDPDKPRNGPVVPQNEYLLDGGFITCAKKMLQYLPDIVCPAHTEEYSPSRKDLEEFLEWAYTVRRVMTELIDQPDPNFGMDYRWAHFYPYRSLAGDSQEFEVELVLRNHLFREVKAEVALKFPDDLRCNDPTRSVVIEPKTAVAVPFRIRRASGFGKRRVITADVTMNGQRLGEVAEALVD